MASLRRAQPQARAPCALLARFPSPCMGLAGLCWARIVELRFFGGLSGDAIAVTLDPGARDAKDLPNARLSAGR